jgi:hypothetical protein
LVYVVAVVGAVTTLYGKLSTPFETITVSLGILIYLNVIGSSARENVRFAHFSILLNYIAKTLGLNPSRIVEADEPEPSAADLAILLEKERRGLAWGRDREFESLSTSLGKFAWLAYVRGAVYCIVLWKLGETIL